MERSEAILNLTRLVGSDLRFLAEQNGITVWKSGKVNKGWAGHTIERYLGLPLNSSQSPNFGSWELKVIPLKRLKKSGVIVAKETMAITMIDPVNVSQTSFEKSHLLQKMRKMVIVTRMHHSPAEESSEVMTVSHFDLADEHLYNQIKMDYELVQSTILSDGFAALTGKMGVLIQPRTKGAGHGSISRAFYARTTFLNTLLKPHFDKLT